MKRSILFFFVLFLYAALWAQPAYEPFDVILEEVQIDGAPPLQSFAWGVDGENWLLLGGVTNGLHDHRPPFSFLSADRNAQVHVVNYGSQAVWGASLSNLPAAIAEQLSSTNMEFIQIGEWLYLFGGYGYDAVSGAWITHPKLTVVNVPGAIAAIQSGGDLNPHFRQLEDDVFAVTGGQAGWIDGEFYLVGGQWFDGKYNPHNGPSFVQEYTNAVRRFKIQDVDGQLAMADLVEWYDAQNLHRRDYNMLPQVFPDGTFGYTVFTGVFRPGIELPWLNTVDVSPSGYSVIADFEQLFNQYHSAHLPVYDQTYNTMHSFFFGGIALYYVDEEGSVMMDSLVPFVKHVSRVTRGPDGALSESILDLEMPGLMGASAEFIPVEGIPEAGLGVIDLQSLPEDPVLVGHIYGGIESTQSNIFMQFSGESQASNRIFRVLIHKGVSETSYAVSQPEAGLIKNYFPNPAEDSLQLTGLAKPDQMVRVRLIDQKGQVAKEQELKAEASGAFETRLGLRTISAGLYFLSVQAGDQIEIKRLLVE
ncbi:MAG: T9SS type A sorting domain-containing protein [Lewinellaceae bacterium]|nr:T9SS type A sorting domain-containing protein [Lewinellaceae bacterium]